MPKCILTFFHLWKAWLDLYVEGDVEHQLSRTEIVVLMHLLIGGVISFDFLFYAKMLYKEKK